MLSKVELFEVTTAGPDSKVAEIVSCPNSGSSNQGSNGLWSIETCELANDASCTDEAEAALFGVEAFEDELFSGVTPEPADSVLEVPGSTSTPVLSGWLGASCSAGTSNDEAEDASACSASVAELAAELSAALDSGLAPESVATIGVFAFSCSGEVARFGSTPIETARTNSKAEATETYLPASLDAFLAATEMISETVRPRV